MRRRTLPLNVTKILAGRPTALVAGGAGFLGSHLCERLASHCFVICLDNLRFGKRENIASLSSADFTFVEHDITKPLHDLLQKKVDYIFHVAGVDEVQRQRQATLNDLLLNTYGTRNLLEKAVSDKAKFLLVSTLEKESEVDEKIDTAKARLFAEALTLRYIETFGVDGRIVRVGHLFGPRMPLDTQNPISVILRGLLKEEKTDVSGDELFRIYPVYIKDCIEAILQIMLRSETRGKTFNLLPSKSLSLTEFANLLKEVDPRFMLTFKQVITSQRQLLEEPVRNGTNLFLSTQEKLVEQLKETVRFFRKESLGNGEPFKGRRHEQRFPLRFATLTFIVSLLVFSIILPFLFFAASSAAGTAMLNSAYNGLEKGELVSTARTALSARGFFGTSKASFSVVSLPLTMFRQEEKKRTIISLLRSGEDASLSVLHMANAGLSFGEFFKASVKKKKAEENLKARLDHAVSELNSAKLRFSLLEKELEELEQKDLPDALRRYIRAKKTNLSEQQETLTVLAALSSVMPDILGFDGKRTYLFLLQNNMELRPAGGFIGSYGLVTLEGGILASFEIFDVYTADGQLKGHIEPPPALRKYLGQPNWFLRDSNWDPDFQNSAAQAAWFLEKEIGVSPHGVIAIDVTLAQFLLEALGPLTLPDYKEMITKDNLFEKAEVHSEANFFPGSSEKRDFLGALARRMIDRILYEEDMQWLPVLKALKKGVLEKHLLFSFNNEAVQKTVLLNNWGGGILSLPAREGEGTLYDFRMVSEANLGLNKANFYIKRKVSDEVTIEKEGEMTGKLTLVYTNDGPSTWPGGSYTQYLRVLFPKNTKLLSVAIDEKEASLVKLTPTPSKKVQEKKALELEVEEQEYLDKSIFGFLVEILPKTSKTIAIHYQLPENFPLLPGKNTYTYVFQKQPGVGEDPLSVAVHYPKFLRIKNTNAQVFKEEQLLTLSTNLAQDRLFEVEFLR